MPVGARGRSAPDARARGRGLVGRRRRSRARLRRAPVVAASRRVRADRRGRPPARRAAAGELRQGALEGVVMEAVAQGGGRPARPTCGRGDVRAERRRARAGGAEEGAAGLGRFALRLLSPVAPMLASPAGDADEALERLGEAAFEYKLDGARVQVHRAGDEVRVFTRQLHDVTARVPEVVEGVRALPAREARARRRGARAARRTAGRSPSRRRCAASAAARTSRPRARRCRSRPSSSTCSTSTVKGRSCRCPYSERSSGCRRLVEPSLAPAAHRHPRRGGGRALLRAGARAGHEGLMAKALDAPYAAGQRGFHWLKLKPAHTLDLVVLAVEWGSGRRSRLALQPAPRRARRARAASSSCSARRSRA